jgi:two-component system, NarL family, nitrate/nitrite response regulator NarL
MAKGIESIRILLVDDHAVMRAGLRMLIENYSHLEVVGEASNKAKALAETARARPHLVLLDLDLGDESGLDFMNELLAMDEELRVLVLTGVRDAELHRRAVQLGAMGVVMKDRAAEVLIKAIEKVHAGEVWLDHSTMAKVLMDARRSQERPKPNPEEAKIYSLTKREREIIALVAVGCGTRQLGKRLFISEKTVRNHLSTVYSKLGVSDRLELALYAARHGLAAIRQS